MLLVMEDHIDSNIGVPENINGGLDFRHRSETIRNETLLGKFMHKCENIFPSKMVMQPPPKKKNPGYFGKYCFSQKNC